MSRLDSHIIAVQNRLTLEILLRAAGWTTLAYSGLAVVVALAHKLFRWTPPGGLIAWGVGGAALSLVVAMLWAIIKRPGGYEAAVAIDEKLALKEKFSTALYARGIKDEFAQAAVRDAERTAENVSLYKRFPLTFPQTFGGTILLFCVMLAVLWLVPPIQWSSASVEANKPKLSDPVQQAEAKKIIEDALVKVEAQAKIMPEDPTLGAIKAELHKLLKNPPKETQSARLTAMNKLQEAAEAMNRRISEDRMAAMSRENEKLFKALGMAPQEKGKVADFQRNLARSDFEKAQKDLDNLLKNMGNMDPKEKEKAGEAMKDLAEKLQQLANNPQARQDLEKKLQKGGMSKDQAQQMAQAIQQAAQGNQQAMQNLQQQVQEQVARKMEELQKQAAAGNPQAQQQIQQLQQQQQAMQQAMQQGLGQCQGQQAAAQMGQAAQQMAQAMQQGNDPGAQQAGRQMQQQLAQLGQNANQAQNLQDAARQAQDAADAAAGQCNNPGQGQGGQGQWQAGEAQNQGNGAGGPGIGMGDRSGKEVAPFTTSTEKSPSQNQENGKILASQLVKASALKGESKEQMKVIVEAGQQERPDEVEQDRVPRQSMKAVKDYFKSMEGDTK